MNMNTNKVYLTLKTQLPALYYPLAAFSKNDYVDEIIIVIRNEDRAGMQEIITHDKFTRKPIVLTVGGKKRYDSVYNGLLKAAGDIVIIHDGARPVLKQRFISECVEAMNEYSGVFIGVKSIDRICVVDENGYVVDQRLKGDLYRVQTPQCFHADILKLCHERITDKSSVTDDSTLLEMCGYTVKILPGDETNIKITVPSDLILAEQYISYDKEMQELIG